MYLVEPLPRPEYPPEHPPEYPPEHPPRPLSPRMQRIMADLSKLVSNIHIHTFSEHYYNFYNYTNDVSLRHLINYPSTGPFHEIG